MTANAFGEATPAGSADILIVDDRPDKLLVYRTILEDLDQNLFTAASGEQALKQVLERDFAVILLDVNMPGLNGLETAALIRNRNRSAHIPIIFITADFNDEHHMQKGYALGAVDYIASPVVPEILQAKVKVFVDLFLLAQQAKRQAAEHLALAEERVARAAAEQATRRLAFLAQASVALAGSLDAAAISGELVRLCVPILADVGALTLLDEQREEACTEVAWAGEDPTRAPLSRSVNANADRWYDQTVQRVRTSGKLEVFSNRAGIPASKRLDESPLAGLIDASVAQAIHCVAFMPLLARGRILGVLALALRSPGREFDADALAMATDLAGRAATALDNALLYGKIQEEDRRKDEFLAILAHELRNPLAPISNAVHVLQMSEQTPAKLNWATDVIGRQLKQLVRLVDDLLDVSRITRGKIELKIESIDVGEAVVAAVETSRPYVDALEHALTVLLPPERLLVKGDLARVAQVLANLINNAAKYTDRGGRICVTVAREGTEVVFRVRDTGMGIPKELLSSIFEPFTQIHGHLAGGELRAARGGRGARRHLAHACRPTRPARAGGRRQPRCCGKHRRAAAHVGMRRARRLRWRRSAAGNASPASRRRSARYRVAEDQRLPGRRAHPGGTRAPAYAHRRDLRLWPGGAPPPIAAVRLRLSHREADRSAGSDRASRLALVPPQRLRPGERRQLPAAKVGSPVSPSNGAGRAPESDPRYHRLLDWGKTCIGRFVL